MTTFVDEIVRRLGKIIDLPAADIEALVQVPTDISMGDYTLPCFQLAKTMRKAPAAIADELAARIEQGPPFDKIEALKGYLNFFVSRETLAQTVLTRIIDDGSRYGESDIGRGRNIVIDYSSPNIAKPLGVHHIRSTMIGNALYRIFNALGYHSVGWNYLGDWGTQFGQLMVSYKKRESELSRGEITVKDLLELYVQYHKEAEEEETLDDEARAWFKKLEDGDTEAVSLWEKFREESLKEFKRIYARLDVQFDTYEGESRFIKASRDVIGRLQASGLAVGSQGAIVVPLDDLNMPPCLLMKKDGTTLYATRDIAAAEYRYENYQFDQLLYVVGSQQKLHFRQVLKVLELMGHQWAGRCRHVDFGMLSFKGGTFSTRRGRMIFLEDVLDRAVEMARSIIEEKNPGLENKNEVAEMVGVGAVIFGDIKHRRNKDVVFDWDTALNFDGETGPYLQYTYVRLGGIMRKYDNELPHTGDFSLLTNDEERALLRLLGDFPACVRRAALQHEPSVVASYLLDLASSFNTFYQKHRVISEDASLTEARLLLVGAMRTVIRKGLDLLGIKCPERM